MMRRSFFAAALFACLVLSLANRPSRAENWPCFRGPTGQGHSAERDLPLTWSGKDQTNVLWKSPLKGQGHASPIVWGDRVFICTVAWPAEPGASEKARAMVMPEHHVLCYATADGKLLWDAQIPPGPWLRSDFRSGPGGGYAAPTPVTDGKLVYCLFGSSVLAALDFEGKLAWRTEIVPFTFDVTIGSSPVLHQDTVIVLCAMAKPADSRLVAFDKSAGKTRWEQSLKGTAFGHSTPLIIEVGGKPQMLIAASGGSTADKALQSLDPASGAPLWNCRGQGDVTTPVYGGGLVYFDSGRSGGGTAVDPAGASGDISKTHVRWTIPQIPEALGSPIIVGKQLYRVHSPGILKCWDLETGKQLYSQRLDGLSSTWASPVADADGRLFFASAGKSYVIQSGPEFKVLATNDLGDPNHPSPAISGGRIFLVGKQNVWCVGKR